MRQRFPKRFLLRGAVLFTLVIGGSFSSSAQAASPLELCDPNEVRPRSPDWLPQLLKEDPRLLEAMHRAPELRFQLLVAEVITRDGTPDCLRQTAYRVGAEYTYPASSIKMVGAIAALRRMQEKRGWALDSPITILPYERKFAGTPVEISPGVSGETLQTLLESTLIVSSNPAFNALYNIAGRAPQNSIMRESGLDTVRMWHRLSQTTAPPEAHGWLPHVAVDIQGTRHLVHDVGGPDVDVAEQPVGNTMLGRAFVDPVTGEVVDEPMDFSQKNYASLFDLQAMVVGISRPELFVAEQPFGLSAESLGALRKAMTQRPGGESDAQILAAEARFKPLSPGVLQAFGNRERFTYVNKAGRAYGFHLDSAYIHDNMTGRGYFVAVTLWPNENQVLNDNTYEYDSFSYPAFVALGRILTQELLLR